jgi:transcription elongation GreA/GreB family factor
VDADFANDRATIADDMARRSPAPTPRSLGGGRASVYFKVFESAMIDHPMTKAHLRDELARILAGELKILTHAQAQTQHAATHEEAKPENDKDTRALEQSYLARGQAQRVESLRAALAAVAAMSIESAAPEQPIAMGSWVCLESADDGTTMQLYLAPAGGGIALQGQSVHVVTPQAPYGRAILGKKTGDDLEVMIAGKVSGFTIVSAK